jgi:hypothetical protein
MALPKIRLPALVEYKAFDLVYGVNPIAFVPPVDILQ